MLLVNGRPKVTGPEIVESGRPMTAREVGGKFFRQNEMIRAGIKIPPFFCLTAAFYERFFAPLAGKVAASLQGTNFSQPDSIARASQQIRDLFLTAAFSSRDRETIASAVTRAFPDRGLVSVRASMVGFNAAESEDSSQNPFAGMSESFLNVPPEQIVDKILHSLASGFSAESMLYRHTERIDPLGFSVAVGVQQMVPGTRSFVLFTCNPNTAVRETLIIAGHGIGEGVVQEKVEVDHYFLKEGTKEIRKRIAEKERMLAAGPGGHGIATLEVPQALRSAACLSDSEVEALAALGRRIESLFHAPQDIEGTVTPDGVVHILQSRPIAIDTRRQRVWTNANVTESFPGVTTPLTYSVARYFYRVIFHDCYRMLGIDARSLHDQHESLDRMIGYLGGRIYYCLTAFYRLHQQSPLFPLFRAHWEKMMGFQSSYEIRSEGLLARAAQRIRATARFALAAVMILWRFATHQRDIRRFHAWWEGLIAPRRGRDYSHEDPMLVMTDFHEVWRQVGNRWGITLMNDTYLPVIYGNVEGLFRRWNLSEALLSRLLCGDDGLTSVEIVLSAVRLAEHVRSDRQLAALFASTTPEELARMLAARQLPQAFSDRVRTHLDTYGDRGFQELKMEQANLRDTPWLLFRMLQDYVRQDMTAEGYRENERRVRADAEAELDRALAGHAVRKAVLRWSLSTLRRLVRNRENSRYCRSELFSFSKNVFRGIAAGLVREGKLEQPDNIYFLSMDDIFGFIDGTGVTENLQGLVELRRVEFAANQKHETPIEITTWGPLRRNNIFVRAEASAHEGELRGLGSSVGRVKGVARVVIDPAAPVELGDNGILIARETDPGWLFLMLSAKAIVVERGSMLSHTAITGRKFGIPTVVGVPDATRRIPDGAWIEVDGGTGAVTILEAAPQMQP